MLFIDIFGFSAWLGDNDIGQTAASLRSFHQSCRNYLKGSKDGEVIILCMSDSVVMFSEAEEGDHQAFRRITGHSMAIARVGGEHGFAFRGFASYGEVFLDRGFIHGEAFLRAYRMEDREIRYPEVLTSELELRMAGIFENIRPHCEFKTLKSGEQLLVMQLLKQSRFPTTLAIVNRNIAKISGDQIMPEAKKRKLFEAWQSLLEQANEE